MKKIIVIFAILLMFTLSLSPVFAEETNENVITEDVAQEEKSALAIYAEEKLIPFIFANLTSVIGALAIVIGSLGKVKKSTKELKGVKDEYEKVKNEWLIANKDNKELTDMVKLISDKGIPLAICAVDKAVQNIGNSVKQLEKIEKRLNERMDNIQSEVKLIDDIIKVVFINEPVLVENGKASMIAELVNEYEKTKE